MKCRLLLLCLSIFLLLAIVGCQEPAGEPYEIAEGDVAERADATQDINEKSDDGAGDAAEAQVAAQVDEVSEVACENSDTCSSGVCLNGECQELAVVTQGCTESCVYSRAIISANDGSEFSLVRGDSNYILAGAVGFRFLSFPEYCHETGVPLEIELLHAGEVVGSKVITLREGETSATIEHPSVPGETRFTLKSVERTCSEPAEVAGVEMCADQGCFEEKFAACELAKVEVGLGSVTYLYEIKSLAGDLCEVESSFTSHPNPDWEGKSMVCSYDHSLAFEEAISNTSECNGELYDLMFG